MALMLEWFERVGYSADIAGLEREFGRTLTKLPDWARRHGRLRRARMNAVRLLEYGGQLVSTMCRRRRSHATSSW